MEPCTIYMTNYDLIRLKELLQVGVSLKRRDKEHLETLQGELDRAHVLHPTAIPSDVVTMNSRVRLVDLVTNEEGAYTLVFPSEANLEQGKISILAPIGTAILGCRVGDTVEWRMPGGIRKLRVEQILYQPEAAGQYQL